MLGAEKLFELQTGDGGGSVLRQHIDGSFAVRVDSALIGQQPETQMAAMLLRELGQLVEMIGLQNIDAGLYVAIARLPAAHSAERLVVTGDLCGERSAVRANMQREGCGIGDFAAQRGDAFRSIGMNGVRENDDVAVARGVHPERSAGEAGVAE